MLIRMGISGAGGQETKPNEDGYRLEAVTERDTEGIRTSAIIFWRGLLECGDH